MNPEPGSDGTEEEVLVVQRRPRWVPLLLLAIVVFVGAVFLVAHESSKPSAAPAHSSAPSISEPPPTSSVAPPPPSSSSVAVTELGHPVLGSTGTDELFGRGAGGVVRIQLARGRITTTTVPLLQSSGPVYFAVGKREAIVRPLDFVTGYVVPDGRPARPLSGALGQGGPVLPGPDGNSVWAESQQSTPPVLTLVRLDDARTGPVLPLPRGGSDYPATPDGSGFVLLRGTGGTYDARPDGLHRVTTGTVLAVGPTRWLVRECTSHGRCTIVVIDHPSGARHVLKTSINDENVPGVIAPDGSAAAVFVSASAQIEYIDLATGAEHALPLRLDPSTDPRQSLVWSSDSRWLFALDGTGVLHAVDARTRRITDFRAVGAVLPSLTQIAIR